MLFQHFINFFGYIYMFFHWEFCCACPSNPYHWHQAFPRPPLAPSVYTEDVRPASVPDTVRRSIIIHIHLLHYYTCVNIHKYVVNGKFKVLSACKNKKKIKNLVGIHRGSGTQPHLYHVKYLSITVISIIVEPFRNTTPTIIEVLLYRKK